MTQEQALDILKMGHNVFLTGAPGTGKTFVINEYIDYLFAHNMSVAVTASTGIAATHIGGTTIHSWSGIGIKEKLSEWDVEAMLEKKYIWDRFDKTDVLVIDEVSMLSANLLDSLDMLARTMRNNPAPFGGMQIVLVGDFFQLPPIGGSDVAYAFQANVWKEANMHVCYLEKSYRQDEGPLWSLLCQIRNQDIDEETHLVLADCQELRVDDIEPTRLYTHNADVDTINEEKLSKLKTPLKIFSASTKGTKKHIETLQKTILAPESLRLKENALVMFVKNNLEKGYVNGTMGYIVELDDEIIVETIEGKRINVEPESWTVTNDDGKVLAEVAQLPLRLAWAITVHKSQGMTLDAAEIDLSKCFVPGQGYVALSRVRSIQGLKILGYNSNALVIDETVLFHDKKMKASSEQIKRRLAMTEPSGITKRHTDFIVAKGGSLKKGEKKPKGSRKQSTYEITKVLVLEKMSVAEMAEKRDVSEQTIFNHLEVLRDNGDLSIEDINYLRPTRDTFDNDVLRVGNAIKKAPDEKLSTLKHDMLDDQYSYDELKLIKLFCK
jgi:hypothetical protein